MASFNSTYKIPKDASYVTLRNQNRMLYANAILQRQNQSDGCRGTVGLQNGLVADASIVPKLLEGARETTPEEVALVLASGACPGVAQPTPIPPPPPVGGSGSIFFKAAPSDDDSENGEENGEINYVLYPNDASLALGSGEFTIEWFQFFLEDIDFPRVFSIGSFNEENISIAVSYEGAFILWVNDTATFLTAENPPTNVWTHIALVGDGEGSIRLYIDGVLSGTFEDEYDFTDTTTPLAIGNESVATSVANFRGNITNFRWVKGTQVYTDAFTPPTAPLTDIPGTQLLLLANDSDNFLKDSSSADRTAIEEENVEFSENTPFS